MTNLLKGTIATLLIIISTTAVGQRFDLSVKSYLVYDTVGQIIAIPILNFIGTDTVGFKLGNDNKVIGRFFFHKDSSVGVENYNPVYPYGNYILKKGRYVYKDSVMLEDGIFVYMDMKAINDTSSICSYQKGNLIQVLTFYRGNKKREVINYKGNLLHGGFCQYDTLFNKSVEGNYNHGHYYSKWKYFYPNGTLKAIGKYGRESFKYESQIVFNTHPPLNGTQVVSKPIKVGKWLYYSDSGVLAYIERYSNKGRLKMIKIKSHMSYFKLVQID